MLLGSQGKKNVEVRPAHTNKGEIVQRLLYQHPETEFCMCAGDDKTDEDMVRLPSYVSRSSTQYPHPEIQFHSMSRIFSAAGPGAPPMVSPPESLALFPSLAGDLPPDAYSDDPEFPGLQPVASSLDPSGVYMIAIEAKDTSAARMSELFLLPPISSSLHTMAHVPISLSDGQCGPSLARGYG